MSDEQREQVVRDLTRHCGDGRLTLDELEERIAEAYAATTTAELDHAVRDLPRQPTTITAPRAEPFAPIVDRLPMPPRAAAMVKAHGGGELALKIHLVVYLCVIGFLVAIWFLTSPFGYFWPIWPAMGWGLAIAIHGGVEKIKGGC